MSSADQASHDARGAVATLLQRPAGERREALDRLLAGHPAGIDALTLALAEATTAHARVDLETASALADLARQAAARAIDPQALGRVLRAQGHILALQNRFADAFAAYTAALARFDDAHAPLERAITQSGALQTLIYLGRYDDAFAWAAEARAAFRAAGDDLRLARLATNVGNVLYRQDRLDEALAQYTTALVAFRAAGATQDVAIALRNLAVCQISRAAFDEALAAYREARSWCEQHGLAMLVAEADYNIAYLFFMRGDYAEAIELYRVARARTLAAGDHYHAALCDLDRAELSLELNLVDEGARLAQRAGAQFRTLGLGYERAKALALLGVAEGRRGQAALAIRRFRIARRLFVAERNVLWPALIDLHLALAMEAERPRLARRLCEAARATFVVTDAVSKLALADLLLARLDVRRHAHDAARDRCHAVIGRIGDALPALRYDAHVTLAQIEEAAGRLHRARAEWQRAARCIDDLRGRLHHHDLRAAFLDNKQAVFESLVWLGLELPPPLPIADTFAWIERAKARSLADAMAAQAHMLTTPATVGDEVRDQLRHLRARLHGVQRDIARAEAVPGDDGARLARLRRDAQDCEGALVEVFQSMPAGSDYVALHTGRSVPLDDIRARMPADTVLVEYYETRGTLIAVTIGLGGIAVDRLGPMAAVHEAWRLLQFQLSRHRLASQRPPMASAGLDAVYAHLRRLGALLIDPIARHLGAASHLVVVPHGVLHAIPVHALRDAQGWVLDRWSLSYAPSASVWHACATRARGMGQGLLVMGVSDDATPAIPGEVRAVAATRPGARVLLGEDATAAALREAGPACQTIHIATHGTFRNDNPMFSSIRLADGDLTLFDLYQLHLSADLVTLSGCGTGLGVVTGGDDLIGLTRGLLYAGAQAVLVTLWDAHDESAAALMADFYRRAGGTTDNLAHALRGAMRTARERDPHPFFWAPYVLVGGAGPGARAPAS